MIKEVDKRENKSYRRYLLIPVFVFLLILATDSAVIINPGERGVLLQWGRVTGIVFDEGLHFKVPIMESVDTIDIKTLKLETQASAASSDLQIVTSTIALNYRIKTDSVVYLRQNIGLDYRSKVVDPSIQEAIKAATSQFTAEELITKRPLVREKIKINMQEKLDILTKNSISVEDFNIVNFDFSEEFNRAIESKVSAEQNALRAKNDLERIKIEAQQNIELAKAKAEAIRIESEALRNNPDILKLRQIDKWNGVMPRVITGSSSDLILDLGQTNQRGG